VHNCEPTHTSSFFICSAGVPSPFHSPCSLFCFALSFPSFAFFPRFLILFLIAPVPFQSILILQIPSFSIECPWLAIHLQFLPACLYAHCDDVQTQTTMALKLFFRRYFSAGESEIDSRLARKKPTKPTKGFSH
jgi:hypothetical protein